MSAEPALGELIAGHRRLPALFDQNRTPISLFTLDGACVAANRAASALLAGGADLSGVRLRDLLGDEAGAESDYLARTASGEDFVIASRVAAPGRSRLLPVEIEFAPAVFEERVVGAYVSWRPAPESEAEQSAIARRLQEVSSLFEHSLDSMLALDLSGRVTAANPAALEMFGYKRAELLGRHYQSLVDPDWLSATIGMFVRASAGRAFDDITVVRRKDGTAIDVEGTATPIVVDGLVVGIYAVGRDVTVRRRAEASAREQAERIHELYRVAASSGKSNDEQIAGALELGLRRLRCDGAYLAQIKNGMISYRAAAGTGVPPAGTAKPLVRWIDRIVFESEEALAIDDTAREPWCDEPATPSQRDGRTFIAAPVVVDGVDYGLVAFVAAAPRAEPFVAADRDFVRLIGALLATAIERAEQRRRLDTLAYFDALTGLPNRTLLAERLEETIETARRKNRSFALHFLDLDGFKLVNDGYGHSHGDQVLRAVAHRLSQAVRKSDIVARMGGDEFVLLQPEIARAGEALELAGRLRDLVAAPILIGTHEHRLGCSVGIALYPTDGGDAETLLGRADAALYAVKAHGRNGVAFANSPAGRA